jgi:predicted regulator of Ras-like GTPase activity (Roadblock/LC7/MglB family)
VVVGRPALISRLLVWALLVVAIDGIVIVGGNDDHTPSSRPAQASSTTTTAATGATPTVAGGSDDPAATQATTQTTMITSAGEVVVAHVQGDGDTPSSVAFHVEGQWQLRWRVDQGGNGVAVTVDDDDSGMPMTFAGLTPGEGTTDVTSGCNCTLHVTPDGSAYDVVVVDVEG